MADFKKIIPKSMIGATLPGNSTVEMKEFEVPTPGFGQVLVQTKASTICGSDIRAIYREHTGKGAEGYIPGMVAGHEPCGVIVQEGPGLKEFKTGDRVIVYHISGCGVCYNCRMGYMIACSNPKFRQAYGWQRNGGMAPYILCDEKDLIHLPDELTYKDGAQVACGFGTVYEALEKIDVTGGKGVERAIDCSASDPGRQTCVRASKEWAKIALVGEGNTMTLNPSPDMMHSQKTIYGSWVTSTWKMMDLVDKLVRWGIHPGDLITDEFPIEKADEAYALMASGKCGKVAVVYPD